MGGTSGLGCRCSSTETSIPGMWIWRGGGFGGDRCVYEYRNSSFGGRGAVEQMEAPVEGNALEVTDVCRGRGFELLDAYGMGEWLETRE